MDRSHSFAVMQFHAHDSRDERLNVGLAIISGGKLDVRVPLRLDKLRAISAAVDVDYFRASLSSLPDLDDLIPDRGSMQPVDRLALLSELGPVKMAQCGAFLAHNKLSYEQAVEGLLRTLVEPEPLPPHAKLKRSKLITFVKAAFSRERILAKKHEDISSHRVVSNMKIAEGLQADFVLKNGAMHIIETVDATPESASVRKIVSDIAVAALVLEQARMNYGADTRSRLIFDVSTESEKIAKPSLDAAQNQGAELYNWSSEEDRSRLISTIRDLAVPLEPKRRSKSKMIHSSTQSRFNLQ